MNPNSAISPKSTLKLTLAATDEVVEDMPAVPDVPIAHHAVPLPLSLRPRRKRPIQFLLKNAPVVARKKKEGRESEPVSWAQMYGRRGKNVKETAR